MVPHPRATRFMLLHRRRVFSSGQKLWMGWERKRGKLHELNQLLRGAPDTTFLGAGGAPPRVPADIRYVITLDADTRLPRDAVRRLVGKMAHPLNRPRFDAATGQIVEGYAVLQPRVAPSLPMGSEGSVFQHVFSSASGIDPYAAAVSDVYQDLFGLGSYAGKGIYDVDAFESALAGRVPEGTLLSHDLFEGIFARAGLVSDIEVVEEFPSRYDVAAARQHRWARGDWQLLPWILGRGDAAGDGRGSGTLPLIALWKMLDNLRRTLSAPAALAALVAGLLLPSRCALLWEAFIVRDHRLAGDPAGVHGDVAGSPGNHAAQPPARASQGRGARRDPDRLPGHVPGATGNLDDGCDRSHPVPLVREPSQPAPMGDRRAGEAHVPAHVPERVSAHVRARSSSPLWEPASSLRVRPENGWLSAPFLALWALSPAIAVWISRSPAAAGHLALSAGDQRALRLVARRTWRYFETFVTAGEQMLPPDNFQDDPRPVVAHRTSPTNMGLYLLSAVCARDFGWLGTVDFVERLRGDARNPRAPRALSRPLLQLVRHARYARSRAPLRVHRGLAAIWPDI